MRCVQVRKAVQSTLILFPMLGITNFLFFINPKKVQSTSEHQFVYMLVNSILRSSQVLGKYVYNRTFDNNIFGLILHYKILHPYEKNVGITLHFTICVMKLKVTDRRADLILKFFVQCSFLL